MSYCGCGVNLADHDIRFKKTRSGVVHAGRITKYGRTSYKYNPDTKQNEVIRRPEDQVIKLACGWESLDYNKNKSKIVNKTETITCKNCQRRLGFIDDEPNPLRYAVQNKETGEYFKKSGTCAKWVKDITNATLYTGKRNISYWLKVWEYKDDKDNIITAEEYRKRKASKLPITERRVLNPKYKVKTVELIVKDEYD